MAEAGAGSRVVVIVVFDDVTLLDVAGAGEVFVEANRFGADYQLKIASVDGRDVTTSIGTRLGVTDRISAVDSADTVLVAGSDNLPRRAIDPALVEAVRSVSARTRRMASICTGSFILAQAGLLSGRRATTHWHDARLFARAFRDVTVEPDAVFVRDGDVFTSAGVSSGIDLALALVEMDYGTQLVRDVARWLVVYLKRAGGQSQFSVLVEADPPAQSPLRAVIDAVAADPAANPCGPGVPEHPPADPALPIRARDEPGTLRRIGARRFRPWRTRGRPVRHRDGGDGRLRQHRNAETGVRQPPGHQPESLSGEVPNGLRLKAIWCCCTW